MAFLLQDGNILFSSALALMLMIALMEGALVLIGFGLSQFLDNLLPDVDLHTNLPDGATPGGMVQFLGWLRLGRVPALVALIIFLTLFGTFGILLQLSWFSIAGVTLPVWLAAIISLLAALPVIRFTLGAISRFALTDESEAVSRDSFIGRVAVITVGEARSGSPAEARFSDQFGTTHYVMVEPSDEQVYRQGQKVLLAEACGAKFRVIDPPAECFE